MNLLQLTYFKKVAELEHISRAAEQLMISQPSLTKTIRHLETELDAALFHRSGNSISISEKGEIVLKYTNQILQNVDDMCRELKDTSALNNNTVYIAVKAAASVIPKYILGFKKLFPDVNISITQTTLDLADLNTTPPYDYFIYSSVEKPIQSNIITLLQEPCHLAIPSNHPFVNDEVVDIKNCSKERFLILRQQSPISELTNTICNSAGFIPRIDLTCDSWETIYSLIDASMGIALLPAYTWNVSNLPHNIVLKPLTQPVYRHINICWNYDHSHSENAILFRKYLISFFHDLCIDSSNSINVNKQ